MEETQKQPSQQPVQTQPNIPNTPTSPEQKMQNFSKKIITLVIIILIVVGGYIAYRQLQLKQTYIKAQSTEVSVPIGNAKDTLIVAENIDEDGLAADTKEFQPFINYLVSQLKNQGIVKGEFVGTKSVAEMTELVREGQVDMIIDSAFPVYVVDNLTGAEPLADRWKGGVGTYHTAIFVKQNSLIKNIDDLKGKMLAFDSNTSTVGYFLPKAELVKQGYTLVQKSNATDPCPPNDICYVFVHGNVYDAVAKGLVSAGAESELEINAYYGANIKDYRFIMRTPDILRFMVATRGDLDPRLRKVIGDVLFSMHKTPQGKAVLSSFADTAKFTPVSNSDAAYGEIKNLTDLVEQEIISQ